MTLAELYALRNQLGGLNPLDNVDTGISQPLGQSFDSGFTYANPKTASALQGATLEGSNANLGDPHSLDVFFDNMRTKATDLGAKAKGLGAQGLNYAKNNKAMTAGLGITGAANLAGLVDNDKIGGQLLGGGLGTAAGFGAKALGAKLGVPQLALAGMTGGSLGALFDNLRAKKEQQYNGGIY